MSVGARFDSPCFKYFKFSVCERLCLKGSFLFRLLRLLVASLLHLRLKKTCILRRCAGFSVRTASCRNWTRVYWTKQRTGMDWKTGSGDNPASRGPRHHRSPDPPGEDGSLKYRRVHLLLFWMNATILNKFSYFSPWFSHNELTDAQLSLFLIFVFLFSQWLCCCGRAETRRRPRPKALRTHEAAAVPWKLSSSLLGHLE